ncbi:MAG: crossover junction endodeoxyribonuclease RuvC [Anaerolineae bacterium]|nr:crossover junction endodeoxyribonuclease RuvC [Anaerolineae bacterium]NIN96611.1 crossover junction endodeoxyribonuclease RuvC [Anaerolineae bacterium]NIQ79644.1 crossover junction endodeoxyribonuclease RuvC [Anaerolineae bacterium]
MLVLGIDPGTAITGWGAVRKQGDDLILVDYGTVDTSHDIPLPQRLQTIHRELGEIVSQHHPDAVAVETLFFSKNVKTALSVGQARGVALLAIAEAGIPFHEYTPLEVKQSVVGYGRATKDQIQQLVKMLLRLDSVPQPDDAADAIAVAICHIHSARLEAMLAAEEGNR